MALLLKRTGLRCSFCKKTAAQVSKLLGGPKVHICDACESTAGREKLHRFRWTAGRLVDPLATRDARLGLETASLRGCGSHNFGLPDVLRLAEIMRRLPQHVTIWGIEGLRFQPGDVMTEETRCTALRAVRAIMAEFGVGSIEPCL